MKRWIAIAACVMTVAACQDGAEPVGPTSQDVLPVHLLGLTPTVKIDPVLTSLLNTASPLEKLQVVVTYDPTRTTGDAVSQALTSSGAQGLSDDGRTDVASVVDLVTAAPAVVGQDLTDCCEEGPAQAAVRRRLVHDGRRPLVRRDRGVGDVVEPVGARAPTSRGGVLRPAR